MRNCRSVAGKRALGILMILSSVGFPGLASAQTRHSLEDLVRHSLADNPDIEQLICGSRADRAALEEAQADLLPSVKLSSYNSYIANPQAPYTIAKGSVGVLPIPGVGAIPLPESDTVVVPGAEHWAFDAEVQITQPIVSWGKIRSNIALRRNMSSVDNLKTKKKQDELQTLVRVDYYSLYYLNELHELLSEQKAVADKLLHVAQDSFAIGQINQAELVEKRMKAQEVSHAIASVEEQRESMLRDLRTETGMSDLTGDNVDFTAIDEQLAQRTLLEEQLLVQRALGQNNDIKLSTAAEEIYRNKVDIARSDTLLKPDLALSLRFGYMGPVLNDWNVQDDWVANLTLAISAQLYDGGKSAAAVAEAQAQLEQARSQTRSAERAVSKYILQTRYELGVAKENIAYYQQRASDAQAIGDYQKMLLDAGAGSKVEYYQRVVDVFTERAHVIEQQIAYAARYFTLQNVTGGL